MHIDICLPFSVSWKQGYFSFQYITLLDYSPYLENPTWTKRSLTSVMITTVIYLLSDSETNQSSVSTTLSLTGTFLVLRKSGTAWKLTPLCKPCLPLLRLYSTTGNFCMSKPSVPWWDFTIPWSPSLISLLWHHFCCDISHGLLCYRLLRVHLLCTSSLSPSWSLTLAWVSLVCCTGFCLKMDITIAVFRPCSAPPHLGVDAPLPCPYLMALGLIFSRRERAERMGSHLSSRTYNPRNAPSQRFGYCLNSSS